MSETRGQDGHYFGGRCVKVKEGNLGLGEEVVEVIGGGSWMS